MWLICIIRLVPRATCRQRHWRVKSTYTTWSHSSRWTSTRWVLSFGKLPPGVTCLMVRPIITGKGQSDMPFICIRRRNSNGKANQNRERVMCDCLVFAYNTISSKNSQSQTHLSFQLLFSVTHRLTSEYFCAAGIPRPNLLRHHFSYKPPTSIE